MNCYIKFLAMIFVFCAFDYLQAQGTMTPDWVIRRTSPINNTDAEAWGIAVDGQGNLYWATNQTRPGVFQGLDVVFYKLDPTGNEIWSAPAIYAGQFAQQAYNAKVANGIAYFCGRNCRNISLNLELCDMLLVAVDITNGDTLWTVTWDQGFGYDEADGLIIENDGIYLTGWTDSGSNDLDVGLLKFDLDGHLLWAQPWGTGRVEHQDGHIAFDDSVIYIAGLYDGDTNPVAALKGFNGQALLAKFSKSDGRYLDHVAFGRDDSWTNFENALGLASDGTFLYVVGITTVSENNNDLFLTKYDKNLNQLWYQTWGDQEAESARAIAVGDDGMIYLGGNTTSFGSGGLEAVLLKYSPTGELMAYKTWGGTANDNLLDIATYRHFLYATGKTQSFNPNGKFDAFLIKVNLDSLVSSIEEQPVKLQFALLQNYPNPFNPTTTIEYHLQKSGKVTLRIYNLLGERVKTLVEEVKPPGIYKIDWNGKNHQGLQVGTGLYVVRMVAGDFVKSKKIWLIK
ncbi:MAG: T9SS type A sorting domain-containing protein [bacterium]